MSKLPPPTKNMKGNSIGNTELREVVKNAKKLITKISKQEKEKKKKGYVWVVKYRESRFVSPDRVQHYLDQGFKLSKK